MLSDRGNDVARSYGLAFQLADLLIPIYRDFGIDLPSHNDAGAWELPIPGTFVLDRDGIVRLAFVDPDYTTRLEPAAILDALRAL